LRKEKRSRESIRRW